MKKVLAMFGILVAMCLLMTLLEWVLQVRDLLARASGDANVSILRAFITLVSDTSYWEQLTRPSFLSTYNLQNAAKRIGMYGIFSIGLGVVIISGGIDLSVGAIFAVLGVVLAIMLRQPDAGWGWHWAFVVPVILLIACAIGLWHGLLIAKARLQPFIVTLSGLMIYRGVARYIANDESRGFGGESFGMFRQLTTGSLFNIPAAFIYLVVIATIMWFVVHRSVYGRYLFAVGRNEMAAKYSGINTRLVIGSTYVICALLAGVSGILLAVDTGSVSAADFGNAYELYGIAAAVLGGCSLRGGEGSVIGIVIGTAVLRVLENMNNLLDVPSSLNFAVMGVVILIGVSVDEYFKRRKRAKVVVVPAAPAAG